MTTPDQRAKAHRIARLLLAGGLVLLGLWIARAFLPALAWAAILAVAVDPLHVRLRRTALGRSRHALPLLITLVAALAVLVPLAIGITLAARDAHDLALWIAEVQANGIPEPDWVAGLPFGAHAVSGWWQAHLATPQAATEQFHSFSTGMWLEHTRRIGTGLLHRSVIFAFTLITLFFLLRERDSVTRQVRVGAHRLFGPTGELVMIQGIRSIRGTIDGLVLVGLGEGVAIGIAYLLLGVPHPLLLGALTAVAAMIPFGAPLLIALAGVLLMVQGSMGGAVAVILFGFAVVLVADHFVRPALIGGATRLPFLWVLIGIFGGVESFGLLGLFIGPATMAVLVMLWREFLEHDRPAEPAS